MNEQAKRESNERHSNDKNVKTQKKRNIMEVAKTFYKNGDVNDFGIIKDGVEIGEGHYGEAGEKYESIFDSERCDVIHKYFNGEGRLTMLEEIHWDTNDNFFETRTFFSETERPKLEIQYINDIEDGFETKWYKCGRVQFISLWADGKRNGPYVEWNEFGHKKIQGVWKNNKESGTWIFLDESDNTYGQDSFKHGNLITEGVHMNKYLRNQGMKEVSATQQ